MRFLLAAAALLAALARSHEIEKRQAVDVANRVVCYYTNWSVYRKGLAKYTPQNINPYLCTHLVYAFGGLTDEFEIKPFDSYQDIEQGGYAKFNGLKQYNKGLKTLLAIGGWNEGSGRFSELVSLPEFRKTFIISAIKHLRRYNFDGLDLDWEYPASRDGSTPEDREYYATLVRELREAFDDEGTKVKQGRLLLTMAVPAGQNYIDKGYDIPSLTRDLDFFNILNYDYHSAYEPTVNHHAALMPSPGTSEYAWNAQLNVDWTVKYYISLGADRHKLVIGIPTYGRSYTLIDGNFTDFGASADGPGEQGKYTKENGFMAFYEVCENIASNGWDVSKPFPRRIGPYAYSEDQWVGYDDEKIVARKAEYVRENGLGGIMYWSLDNDDFRGICNGEQYPLVEAGKKALFSDVDLDVSLNEARTLLKSAGGRRTTVSVATQDVDDTRTRGSTGNRFKTEDRSRTRSQSTSRTRGQESTRTRSQNTFQTSSQDTTRTRNQGSFRSRDQDRVRSRSEGDTSPRTQETFRTRDRFQDTFSTRSQDTFRTRSQDRSQDTFRTRAPNRAEDTFRTRAPNRAQDTFSTRSQDDRFQEDRFQEDRFQEDRFQGDRFQEDRFQDDRFQDDRFQDNTRPQTQDTFNTRFQDDRFQDDRFQEDRFQEDRFQDGRFQDNTRPETQDTFRTRAQDRAQDRSQDTRRRNPFRTASQSEGTRTRGGTSFGTTRLPARRPPRIKTSSTRAPASLSTRLQNRRRPSSSRDTATTTSSPTRPTKPSRAPARTPGRTPRPGRGNRRRQGGRRKQTTTTIDPLNTPAPPTTPSPVSGFACKREGFYPNPENCHKYYWCLDSGASGLGVVAHAFTCPSDLVFSKSIDGCDHPTRTKCSTEKKGRGGAAATTQRSSSGSSGSIPTTTEIPVDYSYLDDYYYDDEYYYDYEDPAAADLPAAVEEVPNTVSRQLQNSGGSQFTGGSSSSRGSSLNQETTSTSSSGALGGRTRPQYSSIVRDRSQAQQPAADSSSSRRQEPASNSRRRPEYTTIPRERTAAQARPAEEEVGLAREAAPPTGGREYVVLNRNRPSTSGGAAATPAPIEEQYPTQPTLEYVTIDRSRGRTTSDIPTPPPPPASDSTVSPAQGLVEVAPTSPRYVTIQRGRSTTEEDLTTTLEETTVAGVPAEEATPGSVRIRTRRPPTSARNPTRQRPTRPQPEDASLQPESRQRPTRPLIQISPRPDRPLAESPRLTRPLAESPRPTLAEDDSPRPLRPQLSTVFSPTASPPNVAEEEEAVTALDEVSFQETTVTPESTTRRSFVSLFPKPRATTSTPTTSAPRPLPTTAAPRPLPTTAAPRSRGSPRPRPSPRPRLSPQPRVTTARPPARSPRPPRPVFAKIPVETQESVRPAHSAILAGGDYTDYYYDDLDGALTGTLGQLATLTDKAILMADGSVQCYDTGYFAHPDSCKKFISCSKTVRGVVRGWVYTCPQQLVFDPVGGMCNWAETVDCEGRK